VSTGSTASTYQTVLGIAKEPQPATGAPVAATAFIPVKKLEPDNKPVKLYDESWKGSMVEITGVQAGVQSAELSLGGNVYADTVGWFLAGMLGDVATTGASAPFTHTMALLNSGNGQPTSYTLTDTDPLSTRQYASCRFSELTLKWDAAELLTWEGKAIGWTGATASAPTSSFSTIPPVPAWALTATIGGVAAPNVKSVEDPCIGDCSVGGVTTTPTGGVGGVLAMTGASIAMLIALVLALLAAGAYLVRESYRRKHPVVPTE